MEKHEIMQVDQGLKKVCGIDLSKIINPETSKFLSGSLVGPEKIF